MEDNKKFKLSNGFTLAEVLITLVIIGIVAALVIPATINTYVESSTVSKVKKAQSILGQAKILAEAQNGPVLDWNFEGNGSAVSNAQFWQYLKPYITVVRDCGTSTDCYQTNGVTYLHGNANSNNYGLLAVYYKVVYTDGTVVWFRTGYNGGKCASTSGTYTDVCAYFMVDINGDKAPNNIGRDIFEFEFTPEGVFPNKTDDCRKTSTGFGCANYIIKNSNMKYLH